EYVADQIGIEAGRRILDLGCGWGPLLAFIRERGGTGVGVTLSSAQAEACRRHGLDVRLEDALTVTAQDLGTFDAVASLGGFEHIVRCAEPHFELVSSVSGRLDYIETIKRWRARFAERSLRKTLVKARLVPRWLSSREFRLAFTSGVSANGVCFERELLDHF